MKRSDALKAIEEVIQGIDLNANVKAEADAVLTVLETLGMAPPDHNNYNSEYGEWRYWEDEGKG